MGGLNAPLALLLAALATPVAEPRAGQDALARARQLEDELAQARGDAEATARAQRAAFEAFREDVAAYRLEAAEVLALAMHASADAHWSALSLSLLSTRLGQHERALAVLGERVEREPDAVLRREALERRAIAALGARRPSLARRLLGEALAEGGVDARQILARGALAAGDDRRAARVFAALLPAPDRETPDSFVAAPWALRGWGLAMLPPGVDPRGPAGAPTATERRNPGQAPD